MIGVHKTQKVWNTCVTWDLLGIVKWHIKENKNGIVFILFYYWLLIMLFDIIGWGLILPDQINEYNETIYLLTN